VTSIAIPAEPFAASALPALKPNQPTQSSDAGHGHREVVWRHLCAREAAPVADHECRNQRRDAGIHVHHRSTRVVAETHVGEPAAAPHPMCHGQIDDHEPQRAEQQHRAESDALRECADDQCRRDDREGELEHHEHGLRYRAADGADFYPAQPGFRQTPDEIPAFGERDGVAEDQPKHGYDAAQREALHQHREHVAAADEAAVEQREPRQGHHQHERRRRKQPRGVARIGLLCESQRGREAQSEHERQLRRYFNEHDGSPLLLLAD
jgi:hypothetical protein